MDDATRRPAEFACSVCALPTFHFYVGGEKKEGFEGADPKRIKSAIVKLGGEGVRGEAKAGEDVRPGEPKKDK